MNLELELPNFITPLMKQWLIQYKSQELKEITTLGLFHWDFFPNKRKPEKPRRISRLEEWITLIDDNCKRSVYFLEVDAKTLHVFESSGISLGGFKIAKEYILEDEKFVETHILMKMIS
jgi:hypothetical protein